MQEIRPKNKNWFGAKHIKSIITGFTKALLLAMILNLAFYITPSVANSKGPLVSFELRDVELRDLMRAIGQEHGINIIVDEQVTGKVTVSLRNVPLWDAIDSILKGKGYTYIKDANIVRIIPATEDEDLITRTININYSNPKDLEPIIKKILSKKGEVASDIRTNTIIVKDIPNNVSKAEQMVRALDKASPQVMIDARIVEVNKGDDRSIGIQWGGSYTLSGGNTTTTFEGTTGTDALAVNLPASLPTVSTTPFGAIKIGFLKGSNLSLDLRISAMEQSGQGKVLSNPRILTANNKKAFISTGEKIRIRSSTGTTVVTGGTTSSTGTEEIEAVLKLEVTPQITPDGKVTMNILTKKEEFDWTRTVEKVPAKNSREANTEVTINDGETLVIGGIYTDSNSESVQKVPYLANIPVIGWLFKKKDTYYQTRELLIFLTPTIKREHTSP